MRAQSPLTYASGKSYVGVNGIVGINQLFQTAVKISRSKASRSGETGNVQSTVFGLYDRLVAMEDDGSRCKIVLLFFRLQLFILDRTLHAVYKRNVICWDRGD
jgi:hypothetical protein